MRTHYDVLEVSPAADKDEIRTAILRKKEVADADIAEAERTLLDEATRAKYDAALLLCLPRPQVENADLARNTFVTVMLTAGLCPVPRDWSVDRKLAVCWYGLGVLDACFRNFTQLSLQHAPITLRILFGFLSIALKLEDDIVAAFVSTLERSAPSPDDDYVIGLGATIANSHIRDTEPPDASLFKSFLMRKFPI